MLFVLTMILLFWRRPGQFLYPYVWVEDGSVILINYMDIGVKSLFQTVSGYHILVSKLINFIAYKISFWYYFLMISTLV